MPKRPLQHRLEDKSKIKFQNVLPEIWVYREKNKDYGIDGEVELFGKDEKAQGLIFYVQLKATQSKNKSVILNVDIDIETLKYYKTLEIPVLLVRYSDIDNSIYVKWINNVDLFYAKKGAKSFRIKLSENDKWRSTTHIEIENFLKKTKLLKSGSFSFPIPILVEINDDIINNFSKKILHTQIKRRLKSYPDFVTIQSNPEEALINVYLTNNELKIDASNLASCSFHSINLRKKENFAKNISKDILIGIAFCMIQLGQIEYAGRIIFENGLGSRLKEIKEILEYFIIPLLHSSFFKEAIFLIDEIVDDDNYLGLKIISNFHILLIASKIKSKEKINAIEEFLKRQIDKAMAKKDKQLIGITNYNMGNHYSSINNFFSALHHFNLAKKFAPIYLKQAYFYSDIASVLFRYGKYKYASIFYSKSLELEYNIQTIALLADSLMFAGEYKKAKEKFNEYIKKAEKPDDEFILKNLVLDSIFNEYKIDKQIRNQKEAIKYADVFNNEIYSDTIKQLEVALSHDLLCSFAWFNLGITYYKKKNYDDALFSFTVSALINNKDIGAWINAVISCFNSKDGSYLLKHIVVTAYYYNEELFLEKLYTKLEEKGNPKFIDLFSKIIEEILSEKKEDAIKFPKVRLLNPEGKFETIEDIIKGHNND